MNNNINMAAFVEKSNKDLLELDRSCFSFMNSKFSDLSMKSDYLSSEINIEDYIFSISIGILGGLVSSSKEISEFLNKCHPPHNPDELNSFQKWMNNKFNHAGDGIDKFDLNVGDGKHFYKRDFASKAGDLHRVYFGHDPLSLKADNPFFILSKNNGLFSSVFLALKHLIADTFSKNGLPLPGSSYFDYITSDGGLENHFAAMTRHIKKDVGAQISTQEVFGRLFSIRMQDILAQGLTWALVWVYMEIKGIDDKVARSQLKLMAYSTTFFTNAIKGSLSTGLPYINWVSFSMVVKEFISFFRLNYDDLKTIESETDKMINENIILEKDVFEFGEKLPSLASGGSYLKELDDQYNNFNKLNWGWFMIPLIPILNLAGGLIIGALARQPEINRLKKQVKKLQNEIKRLQGVIREQKRQIGELKIRYDALKAWNFIEKAKVSSSLSARLMQMYCMKDYMELSVLKVKENELSEQQSIFFNLFDKIVNNYADITVEEFAELKKYIFSKYKKEMGQGVEPNLEQSFKDLEAA